MNLRRLIGQLLWWFVEPIYRERRRGFGGALRTGDGKLRYAIEDGDNAEVGVGRFVTGAGA